MKCSAIFIKKPAVSKLFDTEKAKETVSAMHKCPDRAFCMMSVYFQS